MALGHGDSRRNICYLLLPTRHEAALWAIRNGMRVDRFWAGVLAHYCASTHAFSDPAVDVVALVMPDPVIVTGLRPFRVVRMRHPGGNPAAFPRTKLVVWHHTPQVQLCPIAVRVSLEDVTACPRVTLV